MIGKAIASVMYRESKCPLKILSLLSCSPQWTKYIFQIKLFKTVIPKEVLKGLFKTVIPANILNFDIHEV